MIMIKALNAISCYLNDNDYLKAFELGYLPISSTNLI